MKFIQRDPVYIKIEDVSAEDEKALTKVLSYTDTQKVYAAKRLKNNVWLRRRLGDEYINNEVDRLTSESKSTLLEHDDQGYKVLSGMIPILQQKFPEAQFESRDYLAEVKAEHGNLPARLYPFKNNFQRLKMRDYQEEAVKSLLSVSHGHVSMATGCHRAGQEILMFDGSTKKVEDIQINDLLMGPDSSPRTVKSLHTGIQEMCEISPTKGASFVVNMDHILRLVRTNRKARYRDIIAKEVNISVRDYLKTNKTFKHIHKLYRVGVTFSNTEPLPIDPYILGTWLGDGDSSKLGITSMDIEILKIWAQFARSNDLKIRISTQDHTNALSFYLSSAKQQSNRFGNPVFNKFKSMNLLGNKHIPLIYRTASREDRLSLLAGLIDTDGHHLRGGVEISSIYKQLTLDILFLARSLGFAAYCTYKQSKCQTGKIGWYYRVWISGDLSVVPTKLKQKQAPKRKQIKNHLRTGFSVKILPEERYFGFTLDGDGLYLLDDFTVTHNSGKSLTIIEMCLAIGLPCIIATPSVSIAKGIYSDLEKLFDKKYIGMYGAGKKDTDKFILVAVSQSLVRLTPEDTWIKKYEVMHIDEAHQWASDTLYKLAKSTLAHCKLRYFYSATPFRNDGKSLMLNGTMGPCVFEKDTNSLIEEGSLSKVDFTIFHVDSDISYSSSDVLRMNKKHFYENRNIILIIAKLIKHQLDKGNQVLVLVDIHDQEKLLRGHVGGMYEYASAGKDVHGIVERFNNGETRCIVGTSAISIGTNLKPVTMAINWQANKSEIKFRQGIIGRSLRLAPGKTKCDIVDFMVDNVELLKRHAWQRVGIYKDLGPVRHISGKT